MRIILCFVIGIYFSRLPDAAQDLALGLELDHQQLIIMIASWRSNHYDSVNLRYWLTAMSQASMTQALMSQTLDLTAYPHAQRERLRFIDCCLHYFGQVARTDLLQTFQTGLASGTRDLALYRELAPNNLTLRHDTKLYYRTATFTPLFEHDPQLILDKLNKYAWQGLTMGPNLSGICLDAVPTIMPADNILAPLLLAISQRQAISCDYVSLSSGQQSRELVPHTLVNNGRRWHVRAFDRRSQSFRDFVLTRFTRIQPLTLPIIVGEQQAQDTSWHHILPLTLMAHPKLPHPQAIELDYGMEIEKGTARLTLAVREALLGYVMQQWLVDCSADYQLNPAQYPLALADHQQLNAITNKALLPGASL